MTTYGFLLLSFWGVTAWVYREQLIHFALIAVCLTASLILLKLLWKNLHYRRYMRYRNINTMDGLDFGQFVANLLLANGFRNVSLTEKYDYGVDIIAEKYGLRWGIQNKRSSGLVGAGAVRQVVTGLRVYGCDRAVVVTNSAYSSVARRLADVHDCVLIDGEGLHQLTQQRCIL